MSAFTHQPVELPHLPVTGTHMRYPVRRIFCVGRNYEAHTREMGADPQRDPPFFFTKQPTDLMESGAEIAYPSATNDYQPEIELVIAIGKPTVGEVPPEDALPYIYGYAAGLDMTRRDLQLDLIAISKPWDMGKVFGESGVIGAIMPAADIGCPDAGSIRLTVNGETRQTADLADLIWNVPEIIMHLSKYIALMPGDLIFTGTPAGVAPVQAGDLLSGSITGVGGVTARIGPPLEAK